MNPITISPMRTLPIMSGDVAAVSMTSGGSAPSLFPWTPPGATLGEVGVNGPETAEETGPLCTDAEAESGVGGASEGRASPVWTAVGPG